MIPSHQAPPCRNEVPKLWPGWTVEFWQDDWERHVRACDGRFSPAPFDAGAEAGATVLAAAEERRMQRARHRARVAHPRTTPARPPAG
ncbi:hypothetical protein ACIBSV_30980 [Embleya sp. NPDC050154]|uniref:hypothetical protein n=1 Tax=Embleya sp. NPDC050154 TaxID=3363988 RepID=UPI0037A4B8F2